MATRSTSRNTRIAIAHFCGAQKVAPQVGLRLTLHLAKSPRHNERGLTLIEGLIAIVIVSITVISITPPIFWATASRVQTRRAEQSLQLAQAEIDRVRSLVERGDVDRRPANVVLQQLPPTQPGLDEGTLRRNKPVPSVPAPQTAAGNSFVSTGKCGGTNEITSSSTSQYVQVDTDADCKVDFLVQTFRSQGLNSNGEAVKAGEVPGAFVMGVRVYAAVAKDELSAGRGKVEQAPLVGTTGLGLQKIAPLAVLYSTIVPSNRSGNLDLYRKLCNTDSAKC